MKNETVSQSKINFRSLWPVYKRFAIYAKPEAGYYIIACLLIVGVTVTNTAMIWYLGTPFNLIKTGDYAAVFEVAAVFVLVVLLNRIFIFFNNILTEWLHYQFIGRLRNAVFEHLITLSTPKASEYGRGDLLSRLGQDVRRVEYFVVETPLFLLTDTLNLGFYIAMMFFIDIELAVIAVCFSPVFLIHQRYFSPRKRRISKKLYDQNGRLGNFEEQSLANLRGISGFVVEKVFSGRQRQEFKQYQHFGMKNAVLHAWFILTLLLLTYGIGVAVVVYGIIIMEQGKISLSELVSFVLYMGYLAFPIQELAKIPYNCQRDAASADRIDAIMDQVPLTSSPVNARVLEVTEGRIGFHQVEFAYPDGKRLFKSLDFVIQPGETLALVGPSGSGKSTLAKLLLRFYDPDNGYIDIDGQDIKTVSLTSLRRQIGVVWQEPFLIYGTIRDNLLMAQPDADHNSMEHACRAAHFWNVVQSLDQGLDTYLGPQGTELSTGQKQRLAIAQAFLRHTHILLMDEASSALDSESERNISDAINQLRKEQTTILIAHRYSSIRNADRVCYINGDGTVSLGSHEELMAQHEDYRLAVHWQTHHPDRGK